jgi:Uma2 family endonuclease
MSESGVLVSQPWVPRRKLDVVEYHRMAAAGILTEEDRVELIEGELIAMSPIGDRHAGTTLRLNRALFRAAGDRALVGVGHPIRLDRMSEPQPDFVLLAPRADDYTGGHPGPEDVLLAIEVSDSSLRFDRTIKLPLYGGHGIREYWIVDLVGRCVEVCRQPHPGGYASVTRAAPGEDLEPEALPGLRLRVSDILG